MSLNNTVLSARDILQQIRERGVTFGSIFKALNDTAARDGEGRALYDTLTKDALPWALEMVERELCTEVLHLSQQHYGFHFNNVKEQRTSLMGHSCRKQL